MATIERLDDPLLHRAVLRRIDQGGLHRTIVDDIMAIIKDFPAAPTPPVTGSADELVEPKLQDGRRESNQITALQETVGKIEASLTRVWGAIGPRFEGEDSIGYQLTGLARQVQALDRKIDSVDATVQGIDNHTIPGIHSQLAKLSPMPEPGDLGGMRFTKDGDRIWGDYTPPQPAADAGDEADTYDWGLNMLGGIAFSRNGVVVHIASREQLAKVGFVLDGGKSW